MKVFASILAMSIALGSSAAVFAQSSTETITKTTVTETTAAPVTTTTSYVLPGGVSYYVVNPTEGQILGNYVVGQTYAPGSYIVNQTTGEVLATYDTTGLVSMTAVPTAIPTSFKVVNGHLFYYSTDFAQRRTTLEAKVAAEYAAGRLTNKQVGELREKLGEIALLENNKIKGNGTYSKSTVRKIEDRFAEVNGEMSKYVADTQAKKARIGIRVN